MIKRLTIQNFQSHKNSTFEFHEGLNVIIGKTDSGKSAIRRAINWVVKNKPSGNSIWSWWGGVTKVQIEFFDGNIVSRIKEGTKNLYVLNDVEFTAFGTNIPQEIQDVINMNDKPEILHIADRIKILSNPIKITPTVGSFIISIMGYIKLLNIPQYNNNKPITNVI